MKLRQALTGLMVPLLSLVLIACDPGDSDTDPSDATDSSDTSDSSDSSDPSDVTDSSDASDSSDSSDPSDVTDSSEPSDVSDPSESTDTSDSEPVDSRISVSGTVVDDITGLQTVEVEVEIQDESGNGLEGVSLGVDLQPSDKVTLLSAPATDSDGRSLVTLLGNEAGEVTIEIFVDLGGEDVAASATVTIGEGACISSRDYFETRLWGPTIQICRSCHNPIGRARESDAATGEFNDTVMAFPFESDPDFPNHWL